MPVAGTAEDAGTSTTTFNRPAAPAPWNPQGSLSQDRALSPWAGVLAGRARPVGPPPPATGAPGGFFVHEPTGQLRAPLHAGCTRSRWLLSRPGLWGRAVTVICLLLPAEYAWRPSRSAVQTPGLCAPPATPSCHPLHQPLGSAVAHRSSLEPPSPRAQPHPTLLHGRAHFAPVCPPPARR